MDQVKEILRQLIKYRFWIAVGISALLPVIAYAVGSGPIKQKAATETQAIESAQKGVQEYANGVKPNRQYKPLVDQKKDVLSKDVNATWKKLYQRQAPLLTWPSTVEDRFRNWGNKWPENVDASAVRVAIIDYINEYPKQVTDVYQTFRPFDPVDGKGVVSAPAEAMLLKPAPFKAEGADLPGLGKIWGAQERLWIQRSLLRVVDEVNKGAKNWDAAKVKQVNLVEVGTSAAQDQVSIAGGLALEEGPPLDPPGTEAAPAAAPEAGSMEAAMMANMGGGALQKADTVMYIKTESAQYKILPFQLVVLIEQDYVQDLLVGLENSPMAIQVSEIAIAKPNTPVTRPEKGANMGMFNEMAMMNRGAMMGGMTTFGGMNPMMMMGSSPSMMMNPMMGMGGTMGGEVRKGVDKRQTDRRKTKQEREEKLKKVTGPTLHDPYYTVVELTVYGQARFYNPPPPDEPAEASQAAEPADAAAAETKKDETKKDEAKKDEAKKDEAKKDEAPKAEAPKAEAGKKDEAPKAEAEKKDEPAKKDEAPKAEAEKKDEPAKKDEAPKADAEKKDTAAPEEKSEPAKGESAAPKSR